MEYIFSNMALLLGFIIYLSYVIYEYLKMKSMTSKVEVYSLVQGVLLLWLKVCSMMDKVQKYKILRNYLTSGKLDNMPKALLIQFKFYMLGLILILLKSKYLFRFVSRCPLAFSSSLTFRDEIILIICITSMLCSIHFINIYCVPLNVFLGYNKKY